MSEQKMIQAAVERIIKNRIHDATAEHIETGIHLDDVPSLVWADILQDVDARLIAAAPTQHDALKSLIKYLDWLVDRGLLDEKWRRDPSLQMHGKPSV